MQTLIVDLDQDYEDYREDVGIKTAIMSFINAALNYGPGQVSAVAPLSSTVYSRNCKDR